MEDSGAVGVVNGAMERCFGSRGCSGWEVWIRGDQLILLVGDFRKEYLRLKGLKEANVGLLDIWVDVLLSELKRMSVSIPFEFQFSAFLLLIALLTSIVIISPHLMPTTPPPALCNPRIRKTVDPHVLLVEHLVWTKLRFPVSSPQRF